MKKIIIIIIKRTYQIQGRVVQVLLKTARSTRKIKLSNEGNVKRASAPQDAEDSMIHGNVYQTKCGRQDTETLLPKDIYGI